jgi:hypothetical protein
MLIEHKRFGVLLVALLAPGSLLGQSFTSVTVSVASQPNPVCGVYLTLQAGGCAFAADYVWSTAGGGWVAGSSTLNPATAPVGYQFYFLPQAGIAASGSVPVYNSAFGQPPTAATEVEVTLTPQQSMDLNLLYPGACTVSACTPLPGQLQIGSIWVLVTGPDAATLDAQRASQLSFVYTPPNGSPTSQVPIPLVREMDASTSWEGTFTETPIAAKVNNPASNNSSFAVLNISSQPQSVLITLTDSYGNLIVSAQTPVLAPNANYGAVLWPMFGNTMFPSCVNNAAAGGVCMALLDPGGDGLVHGHILFTGTGGGKIIPIIMRAIGDSISSMPVVPQDQLTIRTASAARNGTTLAAQQHPTEEKK